MMFKVANGKIDECCKDLLADYRQTVKEARQALMDKDEAAFKQYRDVIKSFIELWIADDNERKRFVDFLTPEEVANPYGFTPLERAIIDARAAKLKGNMQ